MLANDSWFNRYGNVWSNGCCVSLPGKEAYKRKEADKYIKSKTRHLNLIKACSIHTYHINALIHGKQFHLHDLQNHVFFCRIEKQLQNFVLQKKITNLQSKIEQKICSDLPNSF